ADFFQDFEWKTLFAFQFLDERTNFRVHELPDGVANQFLVVSEREVHERIKPMVARERGGVAGARKTSLGRKRITRTLEVFFRTSPRISEKKQGLKIAIRRPKINDHRTICQIE